jgi:hypothetical protein
MEEENKKNHTLQGKEGILLKEESGTQKIISLTLSPHQVVRVSSNGEVFQIQEKEKEVNIENGSSSK